MSGHRAPIHYETDMARCHRCSAPSCATCWDTGQRAGFAQRMKAGHGWGVVLGQLVCDECVKKEKR